MVGGVRSCEVTNHVCEKAPKTPYDEHGNISEFFASRFKRRVEMMRPTVAERDRIFANTDLAYKRMKVLKKEVFVKVALFGSPQMLRDEARDAFPISRQK